MLEKHMRKSFNKFLGSLETVLELNGELGKVGNYTSNKNNKEINVTLYKISAEYTPDNITKAPTSFKYDGKDYSIKYSMSTTPEVSNKEQIDDMWDRVKQKKP